MAISSSCSPYFILFQQLVEIDAGVLVYNLMNSSVVSEAAVISKNALDTYSREKFIRENELCLYRLPFFLLLLIKDDGATLKHYKRTQIKLISNSQFVNNSPVCESIVMKLGQNVCLLYWKVQPFRTSASREMAIRSF